MCNQCGIRPTGTWPGLCEECTREMFAIEFWQMIGDDGDLLEFDQLLDRFILGKEI